MLHPRKSCPETRIGALNELRSSRTNSSVMSRLTVKKEGGWVPQPPRLCQSAPSRTEFGFGLDVSREGAGNSTRGGRGTPRQFLRKSLQLLTIPQVKKPKGQKSSEQKSRGHGRLARDCKSITGETPVPSDQTSRLDSSILLSCCSLPVPLSRAHLSSNKPKFFLHHIHRGCLEKLVTIIIH